MGARLAILVTNDISFDQRLLKSCHALHDLMAQKIRVYGVARQKKEINPLPAYIIHKLIYVLFRKGPMFYLEVNVRFIWQLWSNRNGFDAVLSMDADTLLAAQLFSRITGKKLYYDAHEWFTEVPELLEKPLVRNIWTLIEKAGVKRATSCYTVAPLLAQKLSEGYQKPFHFVRNCPELTSFPEPGIRENIILYQGALNEGRCLHLFLDLAHRLKNYRFILAGSGDLEGEILERIQKESLSNVEAVGKLHPDELRELTKKARFGFNLLEARSLSYYYSLANKFFDYAIAGTISLNSYLPEYIQLTEEFGHALLCENDPDVLCRQIQEMDEQSFLDMQQKGFELIKAIHWQQESQKFREIFHDLI